MKPEEIISDLKSEIALVEAQGHTTVTTAGLKEYLNIIEEEIAGSGEIDSLEHEGMLADYNARVTISVELLKATLEAGKSALQSIIIINGGAVIALMGMLSSLFSKPESGKFAVALACPLLMFGLGVLSGAVGFACRYFSQSIYGQTPYVNENKNATFGHVFKYTAIAAGIFGYVLFGVGIFQSYNAVLSTFIS